MRDEIIVNYFNLRLTAPEIALFLEPATTAEDALQLYLDLLDQINAIP